MRTLLTPPTAASFAFALVCGCNGGPTSSPPPTTTTTAPASAFEIKTLLTVYTSNEELAQFTEGTTRDERIGRILLGVSSLEVGRTVLDNEALRNELQAALNRANEQFQEADFRAAFGETRERLTRFLNDADSDGWSIDGRSGLGRDWPYDSNGNDPDGWTGQMVVTVTRP